MGRRKSESSVSDSGSVSGSVASMTSTSSTSSRRSLAGRAVRKVKKRTGRLFKGSPKRDDDDDHKKDSPPKGVVVGNVGVTEDALSLPTIVESPERYMEKSPMAMSAPTESYVPSPDLTVKSSNAMSEIRDETEETSRRKEATTDYGAETKNDVGQSAEAVAPPVSAEETKLNALERAKEEVMEIPPTATDTSLERTSTTLSPPQPQTTNNSPPSASRSRKSNKKSPRSTTSSSSNPPIHVVLLLMDPDTRRFEILMLDFDAPRALVSDVLAQVPRSATEPSFRSAEFDGVCDKNGVIMNPKSRLGEHIALGSDVALAIPKGMHGKDVSEMARPILGDGKVMVMLRAHGIDVSFPVENGLQSSPNERAKESSISKTPSNREVRSTTKDSQTPQKPTSRSLLPKIVALLLPLLFVTICHLWMSSPLQPGDILPPGSRKIRCGLFRHFPQSISTKLCTVNEGENEVVEMGLDGILRVHKKGQDEVLQFSGGDCVVEEDSDERCVLGVTVKSGGIILVGGKEIANRVKTSDDQEEEQGEGEGEAEVLLGYDQWPFTSLEEDTRTLASLVNNIPSSIKKLM